MVKTIALVVIAVVLVLFGGYWIAFGTLAPCDALRGEIRRVAQAKAGLLGKTVVGTYADAKTEAYTPAQCFGKSIRLKWGGAEVLGDVLED